MRRLLGLAVGAWACGAIVWTAACVGDDPDPSSPSGADTGTADTNAIPDSDLPDDSPGDAGTGPGCDRSKAFGAPVPVTSLNTADSEYSPWLSADGLTVHFTRKIGDAGPVHIWTASRPTRDADFGPARRLEELVTPTSEKAPSLTADGLFIYFASAGDGGNTDLYAANRGDVDAAFGTPTRLPFSSIRVNDTPHVLPDNTALYSSVRGELDSGGFDGVYRLYRSNLPAGPRSLLATPPHIPGYEAISPVVTPDETMLVFSALPSGDAGKVVGFKDKWDIFTSRRASKNDPWGAPVIEQTLNSDYNEFPHWISPDGCELWLDQEGANDNDDIFVARRPL